MKKNLVMMQSQLHKNRSKSDNSKTAICSVNNYKLSFRYISAPIKHLGKNYLGVLPWEHYGIIASNALNGKIDYQCVTKLILVQTWSQSDARSTL